MVLICTVKVVTASSGLRQDRLHVLAFDSAEPGALQAFLNGERLGRVATGRGAPESVLRVPRGALFRGDNLLTLQAADGVPGGARLRSVRLRPPG